MMGAWSDHVMGDVRFSNIGDERGGDKEMIKARVHFMGRRIKRELFSGWEFDPP